jgi:hypothetical protein
MQCARQTCQKGCNRITIRGKFANVATNAEHLARSGQHDASHLWIIGTVQGGRQQRIRHRLIQCIVLFGAVQGDFCDTICYIQKDRSGHA